MASNQLISTLEKLKNAVNWLRRWKTKKCATSHCSIRMNSDIYNKKISFKTFLRLLKDKGLYVRWKVNFISQHGKKSKYAPPIIMTYGEWIDSTLVWSQTCEGHSFWSRECYFTS